MSRKGRIVAGMKKTQMNALEKIMAGFAKHNGQEFKKEELVEQVKPLVSQEDNMYIAQSILNFFAARIQPRLGDIKGETERQFDARYREWRIKVCKVCNEEFAYAFRFDGVANCSYACMEKALHEIGIKMERGRDLTLRWGVYSHPAIVPPDALQALKETYFEAVPDAFALSQ